MGDKPFGVDYEVLSSLSKQIKSIYDMGVEICLVIGGGNIFRGAKEAAKGMDRSMADQVGMMASVMNALFLQDSLEKVGVKTAVMSGLEINKVCEPYVYRNAVSCLADSKVIIFAAGTGNPYFTTDTAAALRAAETEAEIILLGKAIDGVYSADPKLDPTATKFDKISYLDVLNKDLKVMDSTATALCKDNNIPLLVFAISDPENIVRAIKGEVVGTVVS